MIVGPMGWPDDKDLNYPHGMVFIHGFGSVNAKRQRPNQSSLKHTMLWGHIEA